MDLRTGEMYGTKQEALDAGVPASDIAEIVRNDKDIPEVRFASGPFKNRVYKRAPNGQLIRVSGDFKGYVTKNDGHGNPIRVKV